MTELNLNKTFNTSIKKARTPEGKWIRGYVWRGADNAYIIPENLGVSVSDEKTFTKLSAPVEKIIPETICSPTFFLDRKGRTIYYGDYIECSGDLWTVEFDDEKLSPILTRQKLTRNDHIIKRELSREIAPYCQVYGNMHNPFWFVDERTRIILTVNGELTDVKAEVSEDTSYSEICEKILPALIKEYKS